MDQVFFLIKAHEVYVGEYYKKEIKQVKFKDKDFWEVFDQHDFIEFVDHLNYPMNYNEFKNNKVRILYDNPQKYDMLDSIQHVFGKAHDVKVGQLLPYIMKAYTVKCLEENIQNKAYILYEQTYYRIIQEKPIDHEVCLDAEVIDEMFTLEVLGDIDESLLQQIEDQVCEVTTVEVSKALYEDDTMVVTLGSHYPVLAPVNLYREGTDWGKQKFLETQHTINTLKTIADQTSVSRDTILFEYTKIVHKLFGRQQTQTLYKKAGREGVYFDYYQEGNENLWAKKGQLIGIIGSETDTITTLQVWINKVGFQYNQ